MNGKVEMTKQQKQAYRAFLYTVLATAVFTLALLVYAAYWDRIPSAIRIRAGVEEELDFHVPVSGPTVMVRTIFV